MEQSTIGIVAVQNKKGKALTSFILGCISIFAWIIPIIGAPVSIVGIVMGCLGIKYPRKWMPVVGIILCSITLIAAIVNGVLGAMMAINQMNEILK